MNKHYSYRFHGSDISLALNVGGIDIRKFSCTRAMALPKRIYNFLLTELKSGMISPIKKITFKFNWRKQTVAKTCKNSKKSIASFEQLFLVSKILKMIFNGIIDVRVFGYADWRRWMSLFDLNFIFFLAHISSLIFSCVAIDNS